MTPTLSHDVSASERGVRTEIASFKWSSVRGMVEYGRRMNDPSSHRDRSSRSTRDRAKSPARSDDDDSRRHERRHHHRSDRSSSSRRTDRDRDRSRSPKRTSRHSSSSSQRRRETGSDDSGDDSASGHPPAGVAEIGLDDFFIKATELKLWLWEEKGKKLDSLRTDDARRYFKKFTRAWNRGDLSDNFYSGISPASLPSSISTSHSWGFLSKASNQRDLDAAASVRKSIDTGTKERSYDPTSSRRVGGGNGQAVVVGPTMPPPPSSAVEALQNERDELDLVRQGERSRRNSERKRDSRDRRDAERDERATGRDRVVEKRRQGNQSRREFEASREAGGMIDIPDDVLLGGGDGSGGASGTGTFEDAIRERERAKQRREGWKQGVNAEKQAAISDKFSAYKQKEDATMAQFRALAAQRFGPPPSQ
ncbi:hypothetical protein JCM3766R1_005774 [Sporobolomyces carnicolor]